MVSAVLNIIMYMYYSRLDFVLVNWGYHFDFGLTLSCTVHVHMYMYTCTVYMYMYIVIPYTYSGKVSWGVNFHELCD